MRSSDAGSSSNDFNFFEFSFYIAHTIWKNLFLVDLLKIQILGVLKFSTILSYEIGGV